MVVFYKPDISHFIEQRIIDDALQHVIINEINPYKFKRRLFMKYKTLAITGATSGIGKATAERLAGDFDEIILLVRNVVKQAPALKR